MSTQADDLLVRLHAQFRYPPGEKRATGYLPAADWPVVDGYPTLLFQAYRDGTAGCDWHADADDQAIVSLGATRVLSVRMRHGDRVFLPAGVEHAVLPDLDVTDERISLVYRRSPQ